MVPWLFLAVCLTAALAAFGVSVLLPPIKRWLACEDDLAICVAWGALTLAGYVLFWAYFASPALGRLSNAALLVAASWCGWRRWRTMKWAKRRASEVGVVGALMLLLGFFYLGLLTLWGSDRGPDFLAANRFVARLPLDNEIPRMFADRLEAGESPRHLLGDWLSSDRPPLQTGFILLFRPALSLTGLDGRVTAFAASMYFQLGWVPGLWALLRGAGARVRETAVLIVAVGMTGFCFLNSVFTWPKLGAAGLLLSGVATIAVCPARGRYWACAGLLCALGNLAHVGVLFSLVALAPLVLLIPRWRPRFSHALIGASVFIAVSLPWQLYQHMYEPPANRLLKWQLAGVVQIDSRNTWETLQSSYRQIGWAGALENKRKNLATLFAGEPTALAWWVFDHTASNVEAQRAAEFLYFVRGLGLGAWLWLLAPACCWILWRRRDPEPVRAASTWFLWSILTLCIWIILIFGPATTWIHHGSLVPLLVLWVSPAWLLVRCWPRAACVLLVAQLTSFAATWVPSSHLVPQNISLAALMIAVGSLGGMGMLVWREWRGR